MFTLNDIYSMQLTKFIPLSKNCISRGTFVVIPEQSYFNVLSQDGEDIELQSKNTKHCWKLVKEEGGYTIYHKHNLEDKYHYQTAAGVLYDAILLIVDHDEYQLRNRKHVSREEEKRSNSYFWQLIDMYGIAA